MTAALFCRLVGPNASFGVESVNKFLASLRSLASLGTFGEKYFAPDFLLHVSSTDSAVLWVPTEAIAVVLVKRGRLVVNPHITVLFSFGESTASRFVSIKFSEGCCVSEVLDAVGNHLRDQGDANATICPRTDGALVKFPSTEAAEKAFEGLHLAFSSDERIKLVRQVMISDYCLVQGKWHCDGKMSLGDFLQKIEAREATLAGKKNETFPLSCIVFLLMLPSIHVTFL
jgi:hypothetical protein